MGSLGLGWAAKREPVSKTENNAEGARCGDVCLQPQLEWATRGSGFRAGRLLRQFR